jgi:O-antigen ligase
MKKRSLFTLILIFSLVSIYTLSETRIGDRLIVGLNNASASTNSKTSAGVRLELWQAGLKCIKNNPLSGTGIALHDECFNELNVEQLNTVKPFAFNWIHLHNDVINIVVWMGLVIGTAFFSYLIYSVLFFAKHAKTSHSAAIGLTACISFLLSGLTNTPSMRASAVLLLFAILVLLHHQAALKINKS